MINFFKENIFGIFLLSTFSSLFGAWIFSNWNDNNNKIKKLKQLPCSKPVKDLFFQLRRHAYLEFFGISIYILLGLTLYAICIKFIHIFSKTVFSAPDWFIFVAIIFSTLLMIPLVPLAYKILITTRKTLRKNLGRLSYGQQKYLYNLCRENNYPLIWDHIKSEMLEKEFRRF